MVENSNCARAVATVVVVVVVAAAVAVVVVAAAEDIRSKGVVGTLPTVVDIAEGRDRIDGTSEEVRFPEHRHEVRLGEVRVTMVVCVDTEEGSYLRAVENVDAAADDGNEAAAAWHDCPWVTLSAWILVLD
jgi:hypothetical protein